MLMCAIAGFVDFETDEKTMKEMLQTMHRRGPDGNGVYRKDSCGLLHSRLAIVDIAGGRQPMELDWNREHFVLIYNGELYNTEEVRQALKKEGHSFVTHSDTEVVLHAYAQWGAACLEKLNGIFAFAVWEENAQRLFLARDRIGVKPLFYTLQDGGILFASEIKTILCHPRVHPYLDLDGVSQILLLGPGRKPGSGVLKNIQELEPGCYGYFSEGNLKLHRYWSLKDREHHESFEETAEEVRFLVKDAICRQMVSDVPIGTFLSGGLDSSIISAVCAAQMEQQGSVLDTFSVDYKDNARYFQPGKFQPNSDTAYICEMQEAIHSNHHWTVLTPEDLENCLEDATQARDLPGMADVDFSLLAFCRQIRQKVKVALSGECADEIFGGYPWYRDPEIRSKEGFPWAQTTAQRAQLLHPGLNIAAEDYVQDAYRKTCRESDILPGASPLERRMKEMTNLNFRWFMQTLLDRKDRMSMYCGLEVRVPFCDYRIAEYLYGVPWEYKDYQGREKGLLRYAVQGLLPESVLYRKKSPYPKTFDPQYERLMEKRMAAVLEDEGAPLFYMIERNRLTELLQSPMEWPWYGQLMRRPQMLAFFLQTDFWLRKYKIDFAF